MIERRTAETGPRDSGSPLSRAAFDTPRCACQQRIGRIPVSRRKGAPAASRAARYLIRAQADVAHLSRD